MTRRERIEARLEKRREWAEKRERESATRLKAGMDMFRQMDGQPVLIGHHSEKRHRGAIRRADGHLEKAGEAYKMAERHTSVAGNLEHALERSVFSDDPDAVESLEARMAELERKRARMVLVNKLYRKGDAEGLRELGHDLEALRRRVAAVGYSWVRAPYERYELANLGQRIAADRKRIEAVKARQARAAEAEDAGGVALEISGDWARVTFAEKPARSVLEALKAAGFHWGNGSWSGQRAKLPAELDPAPEAIRREDFQKEEER